jgi:hypothetical protein
MVLANPETKAHSTHQAGKHTTEYRYQQGHPGSKCLQVPINEEHQGRDPTQHPQAREQCKGLLAPPADKKVGCNARQARRGMCESVCV